MDNENIPDPKFMTTVALKKFLSVRNLSTEGERPELQQRVGEIRQNILNPFEFQGTEETPKKRGRSTSPSRATKKTREPSPTPTTTQTTTARGRSKSPSRSTKRGVSPKRTTIVSESGHDEEDSGFQLKRFATGTVFPTAKGLTNSQNRARSPARQSLTSSRDKAPTERIASSENDTFVESRKSSQGISRQTQAQSQPQPQTSPYQIKPATLPPNYRDSSSVSRSVVTPTPLFTRSPQPPQRSQTQTTTTTTNTSTRRSSWTSGTSVVPLLVFRLMVEIFILVSSYFILEYVRNHDYFELVAQQTRDQLEFYQNVVREKMK